MNTKIEAPQGVGTEALFGLFVAAIKPIAHNVPFSLKCSDGKTRWVANMAEENFARLRHGGLKFPVLLRETEDGRAEIIDPRIKAKWLRPNIEMSHTGALPDTK